MSVMKTQAHDLIDRLPEDATWKDLADQVALRQKIEEGLRDLNEGRFADHDEVRQRFLERMRLIRAERAVAGI